MNPQGERWQVRRYLTQGTDERLQIVRNAPKRILLVGTDVDVSHSLPVMCYPNTIFEGYDPRADFLRTAAAARKSGFWQKLAGKTVARHCQVLADPLSGASTDMLQASPSLPRADKIPPVLKSWTNALETNGLLFSIYFGRDSLTELIDRLKDAGVAHKTPALVDMHGLDDMLADSGFCDPIINTAKFELSYRKAATFRQDMETLGLWNVLRFSDIQAAGTFMSKILETEGRSNIAFEAVYGHAVEKLVLPQGESVVRFFLKGQE